MALSLPIETEGNFSDINPTVSKCFSFVDGRIVCERRLPYMVCAGSRYSCVRSYPSIFLSCYEPGRVGGAPVISCVLQQMKYMCYNA